MYLRYFPRLSERSGSMRAIHDVPNTSGANACAEQGRWKASAAPQSETKAQANDYPFCWCMPDLVMWLAAAEADEVRDIPQTSNSRHNEASGGSDSSRSLTSCAERVPRPADKSHAMQRQSEPAGRGWGGGGRYQVGVVRAWRKARRLLSGQSSGWMHTAAMDGLGRHKQSAYGEADARGTRDCAHKDRQGSSVRATRVEIGRRWRHAREARDMSMSKPLRGEVPRHRTEEVAREHVGYVCFVDRRLVGKNIELTLDSTRTAQYCLGGNPCGPFAEGVLEPGGNTVENAAQCKHIDRFGHTSSTQHLTTVSARQKGIQSRPRALASQPSLLKSRKTNGDCLIACQGPCRKF